MRAFAGVVAVLLARAALAQGVPVINENTGDVTNSL